MFVQFHCLGSYENDLYENNFVSHFDKKLFRYKSFRYELLPDRVICPVKLQRSGCDFRPEFFQVVAKDANTKSFVNTTRN